MAFMRIARPTGLPMLLSSLALALGACGGDDGTSGDSVAADIEDQTPYEVSSCTEGKGDGGNGVTSITCDTTTVSGGGPGSPPPGEEAKIIVVEEDGDRTATVVAGGTIIDFFALD